VHGGLRYLQSADLSRFFESVGERRRWLRDFPEQVRPLSCLMPLYGRGLRRPAVLRAALAANDLLSARRDAGVRPDRRIARGRIVSAAETIERFPAVDREGLVAAALWHDAAMPDSQRLVVEMLRWAVSAGATAMNYVEAESLELEDGRVRGVRVRDRVDGTEHRLAAPVVVNCGGPWCREVASRFDKDVGRLFAPSIAFNALIDRPALSESALAVEPRGGGRTYFVTPWKGRLFAGTFHAPCTSDAIPDTVPDDLVEAFLRDLNASIPGLEVRASDVLRLHWGLLPATALGTERLATREILFDHAAEGGPRGLWSVSGVKFTTARLVAEKFLRRCGLVSDRQAGSPSRPAPREVPGRAGIESLLRDDPDRAAARIREVVDEEAVVHLDDLVLRRTEWGSIPTGTAGLAARVAGRIGWDERRAREEIGRLERAIA
jgi:glycerol-3-phosphate dehydrogenase